MAIYHCSIKVGSRAKGQSAVSASAYRSGTKLNDVEVGKVVDYTNKRGVVLSEVALCENAPASYSDRETLWNAVHSIEKAKDSRLWREFEVALPKEFGRTAQIETVREFVKGLTTQGMCVDWSIHDKGDGNPHAHIMATVRSIKADGTWASKSKKVYRLDENGNKIFQKIDKTGRKQYESYKVDYNNWNDKERIEEWRASWARCCNNRLNAEAHIDHRSFKRQGIEQIPTVHEGYAARQIVAHGGQSERVSINVRIKKLNRLIKRLALRISALFSERTSQALNILKQVQGGSSKVNTKYKQYGAMLSNKSSVTQTTQKNDFKAKIEDKSYIINDEIQAENEPYIANMEDDEVNNEFDLTF